MIDEKKLIEELNKINSEYYPSTQVSRIMECINNQPKVQPIAIAPEELARLLFQKVGCTTCEDVTGKCTGTHKCDGYKRWLNFLTGKLR